MSGNAAVRNPSVSVDNFSKGRLKSSFVEAETFTGMFMIRFEQVSKTYPGGFEALKNVSFRIKKGEMIFVAGHSGSGKSTVLKLISGITKPTSGKVWFNNQDLGRTSVIFSRQMAWCLAAMSMTAAFCSVCSHFKNRMLWNL